MTDSLKNIEAVLKSKGNTKQEVYLKTEETFGTFKKALEHAADKLCADCKNDKFTVKYKENGKFEAEIKFAGDVLIFNMHTNVFGFPAEHAVSTSEYVKEDPARQYCGMIEVYNFLADSFKYSRFNDVGYMLARIFINKDGHFFVEGEEQLGFLYKEFDTMVITEDFIKLIIEQAMAYSIEFDLWIPPYQQVKELTVGTKIQQTGTLTHKTGKRLGFAFESDGEFKA